MGLRGNLDLPRLQGKRQPFLGSYFQAKRNGLCNVADRFVFGFALADAAWNSWAFGDPNAIFVPIDRYVEFHVRAPKIVRRLRSKLHGVAVGAILPIQAPFVAAVVNTPGAFGVQLPRQAVRGDGLRPAGGGQPHGGNAAAWGVIIALWSPASPGDHRAAK